MKKYAFIAALFYMSNIIFNIIILINNSFSFILVLQIIFYLILIIKLLRNEHDKVFTITLGLHFAVNFLLTTRTLAFNIIHEQYFMSSEWIAILAYVVNVLGNIHIILLCLMSYLKNQCNEIERPFIPAIFYFIFTLAETLLYTYLANNSSGTLIYNPAEGYFSLIIGTIGIYCVGKFIQNS